VNKEPKLQNNIEEGPDSNESGSDRRSLGQDLLPDIQEDETTIGEKELFNLSHWGCIGYLVLLGVVVVAMAVQLIKSIIEPGNDLASPIIIWIFAIILMIGLIVALGWTRINNRE
jgi:hypothetical protein